MPLKTHCSGLTAHHSPPHLNHPFLQLVPFQRMEVRVQRAERAFDAVHHVLARAEDDRLRVGEFVSALFRKRGWECGRDPVAGGFDVVRMHAVLEQTADDEPLLRFTQRLVDQLGAVTEDPRKHIEKRIPR